MDAPLDSAAAGSEAALEDLGSKVPSRHRSRPAWAVALGIVGELLITAGVLVLLLVVYELYITGIYTHEQQHKFEQKLAVAWRAPADVPAPANESPTSVSPTSIAAEAVPPLGQPVAILHSSRLGASWKWVVVEGVATDDLAKGPGHYPGTVMPGQIGNFVVSGHRTTHGAPFFDTDSLQPGDAIVVQTQYAWYVYKVTGHDVVSPHDVGVVLPVPEQPGAVPTQRLLTLTTCNPRYSASQRLIIHGVLAGTYLTSGPPPTALTTGKA